MKIIGCRVNFKKISMLFINLLCFSVFSAFSIFAQSNDAPVIVQPGSPGQPTKILPATTRGKLPSVSAKDVEFMQGMIMHHGQAVEMTALIEERTTDKGVRLIGAKISQSQTDEMNFMKRWLGLRGEETMMQMKEMSGDGHSHHGGHALMPGMLTPKEMEAMKNAKGAEFDRLFLQGMIKHHEGALVMVKDLFETAGAGQDGELFNFATDVDTGQRGEIKIMQEMLDNKTKGEK